MNDKPVFSRPIRAVDVPAEGTTVEIVADATERAALARRFGLIGVDRFSAALKLRRARAGGIAVSGRFEADVQQTCVVTLDPFEANVADDMEVLFLPEDVAVADDSETDTEVLVDGRLDVGAVAAEFLALALDPHPRKPGAVFQAPPDPENVKISPFAALEAAVGEKKRSDPSAEK